MSFRGCIRLPSVVIAVFTLFHLVSLNHARAAEPPPPPGPVTIYVFDFQFAQNPPEEFKHLVKGGASMLKSDLSMASERLGYREFLSFAEVPDAIEAILRSARIPLPGGQPGNQRAEVQKRPESIERAIKQPRVQQEMQRQGVEYLLLTDCTILPGPRLRLDSRIVRVAGGTISSITSKRCDYSYDKKNPFEAMPNELVQTFAEAHHLRKSSSQEKVNFELSQVNLSLVGIEDKEGNYRMLRDSMRYYLQKFLCGCQLEPGTGNLKLGPDENCDHLPSGVKYLIRTTVYVQQDGKPPIRVYAEFLNDECKSVTVGDAKMQDIKQEQEIEDAAKALVEQIRPGMEQKIKTTP